LLVHPDFMTHQRREAAETQDGKGEGPEPLESWHVCVSVSRTSKRSDFQDRCNFKRGGARRHEASGKR
jgi:hypothetical protein